MKFCAVENTEALCYNIVTVISLENSQRICFRSIALGKGGGSLVSIKFIDLRIRTYVYALGKGRLDLPWMNIMLSGKLEYIVNGAPVLGE